ncbi:isomerase [Georgenia alba]|uniref:Isomerase n=1 Tax=Georgenia alba TaxID=2233858 RepID=A0ABW2Q401_9MICO
MSTTTTPTTAQEYVRFWNLPPQEQRSLGRSLFTPDVLRTTPVGVGTGVEDMVDFSTQFATHVGDYEFRSRAEPDAHHDRVRVPWELLAGGGSFAEGTDVLTLDDAGRITTIVGFLDRAPEGFDHHAHEEG